MTFNSEGLLNVNSSAGAACLLESVCVCVCSAGKGDSFERYVSEAELLMDQSVRLEQAGEVAAALSAVNEAVCKPPCSPWPHLLHLTPTSPAYHTHAH